MTYGEGLYGEGLYGVGSIKEIDFIDSDAIDKFPEIIGRNPLSVLYRYIAAHDEQLNIFESDLNYVKKSQRINGAYGEDLEQLGHLFGPIGQRSDRDDTEYRNYLQSIVESFSARGTKPGIKFAIAGGLNIETEDIEIIEHFNELENSIIIKDWGAHSNATIVTLFNLSSPSGVELRLPIRYKTNSKGTAEVSGSVRAGNADEGLSAGTIGDNYIGFYEEQQE